MKMPRSFRFVAGVLLALVGMILTFRYLVSGGERNGIGIGLLCLLTGGVLVGRSAGTVFRLSAGAACLLMFFVVAPSAIVPVMGTGTEGAGPALLSLALLVLSAVLFSGKLSQFAARPFTGFIDSVYFGNNSREAPPITLRLARAYRRDLRFDEALDECERQLEYHPRSADLWFEIIHIAREQGHTEKMQEYLRKARRRLRPEERPQLEFEFQRYLTAGSQV